MRYNGPIDLFYNDLQVSLEGEILKAVQSVSILVDREELIKALEYDRGQYEKGYADAKNELQAWIPCSERLPEVNLRVLTFAKHMGGAWMIDISSFSGVTNHGKPEFFGYGDKMEVLAWMPLPEPYEEGEA